MTRHFQHWVFRVFVRHPQQHWNTSDVSAVGFLNFDSVLHNITRRRLLLTDSISIIGNLFNCLVISSLIDRKVWKYLLKSRKVESRRYLKEKALAGTFYEYCRLDVKIAERCSCSAWLLTGVVIAGKQEQWRIGGGSGYQMEILLVSPDTSCRPGIYFNCNPIPVLVCAGSDCCWHNRTTSIYLLELETKVHPKVRNHGEGHY